MKRIVVGYDSSEHAKRALERATDIAKMRGARLAVVSAAPVSLFLRGAASPVDPVEAEEREKALAEARAYLADKGVEVDFVEGHGDPADVIVQEAEERGGDLVVVGTRGLERRPALASWLGFHQGGAARAL